MLAFPSALPWLSLLALGASALAQSGWHNATPTLTRSPPVRGFHAATYDLGRSVTVIFGGWNLLGSLGDTWEWNGTAWANATTTAAPPARCCHALAYSLRTGSVLLFGGTDGSSTDFDDTWEYDGVSWVQRQPATRPPPRRMTCMAFDLATGGVLLFGGGRGGTGNPVLADTWLWTGTDWTLLLPVSSPPARWAHGMATDFTRAQIVLYGGVGITPLTDTWTWNGSTWTLRPQATAPPRTFRISLAQDLARNVVVLSGGEPFGGGTWLFDGSAWSLDARAPEPPLGSTVAIAHDIVRGRTVRFGAYNGIGANYSAETWEYDTSGFSTWAPFGRGCAGSAGIPLLQPVGASRPVLGTAWQVELRNLPGSGPAWILVGFSNTFWNGFALPLDLTFLGMPACTLHSSPDLLFLAPVAGGRATLALAVPNTASLVGAAFFAQGVAADPGRNAFGHIVSNAGSGILGAF